MPGEEPTLASFKQKVAGFKAIFPDLEEDMQGAVANPRHHRHWWVDGDAMMQHLGALPA